jgi:hypothetical protein
VCRSAQRLECNLSVAAQCGDRTSAHNVETRNAEKEGENASIWQLKLNAERKMLQAETQELQREEEMEALRTKIQVTVKELDAARENEKNATEIAIRKVEAVVAQVKSCSGPCRVSVRPCGVHAMWLSNVDNVLHAVFARRVRTPCSHAVFARRVRTPCSHAVFARRVRTPCSHAVFARHAQR